MGRHTGTAATVPPGSANSHARRGKLDHELTTRASGQPSGSSRIIVTLQPGASFPPELARFVTKSHRTLGIINGLVLTVPNWLLSKFEAHPSVLAVDVDRPLAKSNFRTSLTVGARPVQAGLGLTGAGVGVAILDSGIASWHDDLTNRTSQSYPYGNQRVAAFVDFVNGNTTPYDDNGHGTHVAGIIAGNGYDSDGQKAGVAPDASLVVLKVLNANGGGNISNIIAAFDWIVQNHAAYNIRVVNASVGAAVQQSYWTDPLTLAAKRVVDAGVAVVAAAGNWGKNAAGQEQYGGIVAPGNAPWVITVGASSTNGTPDRTDDSIATFSSRGPTYKDWSAKPDLVAPGVGTISLAAPSSTLYLTEPQYLVPGSVSTAQLPYLTLTGTSMAAPVVAGTIALMMQANPALTPNLAKAILEYTAQPYAGYNGLTEGTGFLNTLGAVRLAQFFVTAVPGVPIPTQTLWGKKVLWGNHLLGGGFINPAANAFAVGTLWGAARVDYGENIAWGLLCGSPGCDNLSWPGNTPPGHVWGVSNTGDNIVWGAADESDNIVWGTDCGGAECDVVWGSVDTVDNKIWGTADETDNIVWGTTDDVDNIVWGTDDIDNIVWGTDDDIDNIVWGTDDLDNIVWGTTSDANTTWFGAVGQVRLIDWPTLVNESTDAQIFALLKTIVRTSSTPTPVGGVH